MRSNQSPAAAQVSSADRQLTRRKALMMRTFSSGVGCAC
jgi:hypothetical protein